MIHNHMQFHNTAELEELANLPGLRLQRFPQEVRNQMGIEPHRAGRFVSMASSGCEIRFVTDAPFIRITLSSVAVGGDVVVCNGDFFQSIHRLQAGAVTTLHLNKPPMFAAVDPTALQGGRFSPHVWRIIISRNYIADPGFQAVFHDLDVFGHEVRPPKPEELPALRWLAYGSSITHGSGATVNQQSYIQQAARRLGVDVLNKGIGGACLCEPEVADYLMSGVPWDLATLELGVNMRSHFSPDEFEQRAHYLVDGMLRNNPGKPVVLISIYPNSDDVKNSTDGTVSEGTYQNQEFTRRLQKIHRTLNHPDLHYIDGHDILTDFCALTADLIHPSDYGHILMGQNLAQSLQQILAGYDLPLTRST